MYKITIETDNEAAIAHLIPQSAATPPATYPSPVALKKFPKLNIPKISAIALSTAAIAIQVIPQLNKWWDSLPAVKTWQSQVSSFISGKPAQSPAATFSPYTIHTPYLIDNSPSGSYDFTLEQKGNVSVPVPSPCDGEIHRVWFQGKTGNLQTGWGAGNIVQVDCGNMGWLFAHFDFVAVKQGQSVQKGQSLGIQGKTGRSSGIHVHLQFHRLSDWQRITNRAITRPFLEDYFSYLRSGGGVTSSQLIRLRQAILGQESGYNYRLINPHSGALGFAQIMPENLPSWSRDAVGRSVSKREFMANPQLQLQIIDHRLGQYWEYAKTTKKLSEKEAVRCVAAMWYSGQCKLRNNYKPQYYNGHRYPSIAHYSDSILASYLRQK